MPTPDSRPPAGRRPDAPAALPRAVTDAVDRLVAEWGVVEPDLDVAPVAIVNRVLRLAPLFERALGEALAGHDLTLPEFAMLSAVRRGAAVQEEEDDGPASLPQRALAPRLGLTPATVSVRVAALVEAGLVTRRPAASGRGQHVALTAAGRARLDAAVTDHLATERLLLAALPPGSTAALADGLRRLTLEQEVAEAVLPALRARVAGTEETAASFRRLGQEPPRGLLVVAVDPDGPADAAGLRVGDVLSGVAGLDVHGLADLDALHAPAGVVACTVVRAGTEVALRLGPGPEAQQADPA